MAIVIMVAVIIEATTANATIITPDLHTANPATMGNLMANPATTTANPATTTANPAATTTANHTANPAVATTANPKLAMVNPPMDIPRSFLG